MVMVEARSWLCPTAAHRERFLDMQDRVRTARLLTIGCCLALTLVFLQRGGWPVVGLCGVMLMVVVAGSTRLERRRRPELWVFVSTVLNIQVLIAVGAVWLGGPRTAVSCLLAVPVLMVGARFSNRGLLIGAPISGLLVLATTVGVDPGYVWRHPASVGVPLTLVIITAAYLSPLVASDVRNRANSTLDALTGVLNLRALETRFAEVADQAAANGQPVSVVAADIDHFKQINDTHGHAAGDIVLREVAYALRHSLRTFELLYRIGGEEFLLLLPGATSQDAAQIAETMRRAVIEARPLDLPITCSFGVTTSQYSIDPKTLAGQADSALYDAKRAGRNRVQQYEPPGRREDVTPSARAA
jgi:diguanylate cyclase (GGDEF)-like protein